MRLPPAAFLGFGRTGETHLRNLSGLPRVKVVVVADPRREAAALETLRLALAVAKSWRENRPVKLLEIQV